ncbi:MAG: 50S ribosomal protein L21 [Parcubacteria group bacterium GW2011_GWA1_33_6]|nr:MAG: 50S ribosomal protein L21 [Parcubacteria group bacterium GW2011_GWA1_33_6]
MLAIIKTGGKQYLVSPGDKLKVEKIDQEVGKEITLTDVLLCDRNNKVEIGSPLVKGMEIFN